jgi:hypothetical protein
MLVALLGKNGGGGGGSGGGAQQTMGQVRSRPPRNTLTDTKPRGGETLR